MLFLPYLFVKVAENLLTELYKMKKKPKRTTYTIGFRLPDDDPNLKRLERGASECGMSIHTYARFVLVQALEEVERGRVSEELEALRDQMRELRNDVATALETVLMNVTELDEEEVRSFVTEQLRR